MGVQQEHAPRGDGGNAVEEAAAAQVAIAPGPGLTRLLQLREPGPTDVASILAAHPDEQAAIAGYVQQTYGNRFAIDVFQAPRAILDRDGDMLPDAPAPADASRAILDADGDMLPDAASAAPVVPVPAMDPDGPLGASTEVDAGQVAQAELARGVGDENKITNEVFWQRHPSLRGIKLSPGTPAAAEWLRLRDDAVRPALERSSAPVREEPAARRPEPAVELDRVDAAPAHEAKQVASLDNEDDAGAEAIRTTAKQKPPAPRQAKEAADPAIKELFAWIPEGQAGPKGKAAWLIAAIETGLVGAHAETVAQLGQMRDGDQLIHSTEKEPGKGHGKKVEGVTRVKRGKYDIDVGDAPILDVLVTLAASRIQDWVDAGSTKVRAMFSLGTLVRGDVGFGGSQHTKGNAIDLGGMNFNNDKDVVALLDGLEPGKVSKVFPDNKNHVHLSLDGDKYEFGFPFQGTFFPADKKLGAAKKAAEKAAGDPSPGTTIKAQGLELYRTHWFTSTGTYQGDGKWKWSEPASAGKARKHLLSKALQAILDTLDEGGDPDGIPGAMAEDGHDPHEGHDH